MRHCSFRSCFNQARAVTLRVLVFLGLGGFADGTLAQPVTINSETSTYDFHPSTATTETGATWYAWHGYSDGRDQIIARRIDASGHPDALRTVSDEIAVHGPPTIVGQTDDSMVVVWAAKTNDRWQVVLRQLQDGQENGVKAVSDEQYDAIYPTAVRLSAQKLLAVWSAHVNARWRIQGCWIDDAVPSDVFDVSPPDVDAFRPVLAVHDDRVWVIWDQYQRPHYSVHGRVVYPEPSPVEQISPPDSYCLTPRALSHKSGLHVAWLSKIDVVGGPGVVSQWHTLHAAVRKQGAWHPITTPDGNPTAAQLTHGLMAKIDPQPVATGGYLGPRLRPSLLADGDRVWLLWERKSDHRGSTPVVSGDLVGRPSLNAEWQTPVVLEQGRVDYHVIHPPVARNGNVRLVASPLPRRGIRNYEAFEIQLADSRPFAQDPWTGWKPVTCPSSKNWRPAARSRLMAQRTSCFGPICIATTV